MNHGAFRDFCYREYERTLESVESIYKRFPFLATLLVVLVSALQSLWDDGHWSHFLGRVDVTIYYASLCLAALSITISGATFVMCVLPKRYSEVGSLEGYVNWRAQYRSELNALQQYTEAEIDTAVAEHTGSALTKKLSEA
ncbi:MAG: hypothetical protein KF768_06815, partial [Phycisphaeraceae bacterium]|nr:hypothetical protein [Phycisphaeraceae bacterium]